MHLSLQVLEGLVLDVVHRGIHGVQEELPVLRQRLQVPHVGVGKVAQVAVLELRREVTVRIHPRLLRVDDVDDELREGDVMTALTAQPAGVGSELLHDVAPDAGPEYHVGGEQLVHVGRHQPVVWLTNKEEANRGMAVRLDVLQRYERVRL